MPEFTAEEWKIIAHRLEEPYGLADVLEADYGYNVCVVEARAEVLEKLGQYVLKWDELDTAIIRDCCEGSTFFCGLDDAVATGEVASEVQSAYLKAAKSLERKLNVVIPRD